MNETDVRADRSSESQSSSRNQKKRKSNGGKRYSKSHKGHSSTSGGGRDFVPDGKNSVAVSDQDKNAMNDFSWYNKYERLLEAAAKVPFVTRPGSFVGSGDGMGDADNACIPVPGIMSIEYQATVGSSFDNRSPASACARGIYDQIRDAYSGNLQTQPADIFMYMMHIDQFQAFIAWAKRLYGVLNFYTPYNRYAPFKLFQAMFPKSIRPSITEAKFYQWVADKNKLLSVINQLVAMCNKYVFPADFAIFSRHRWMNENVYMDDNTVLSQWYVFCPRGFWMVDGVTGANGTEMNFIPFSERTGANVSTVEDLFQFGIRMYRALADWGDVLTINGYLKRAFEGRLFAPIEEMPVDYTVRPVYQLEVLLQIHNIHMLPEYNELKWTQDPLTHAILSSPDGVYDLSTPILDLPIDDPSKESIVIASRLLPVVRSERGDRDNINRMYCGTEVVNRITMTVPYYSDDNALDQEFVDVDFRFVNNLADQGQRFQYLAHRLWVVPMYNAFAMAPIMPFRYAEVGEGASNNSKFLTTIGHQYNLTSVDKNVLANIHLVCQQSEFNVYAARSL